MPIINNIKKPGDKIEVYNRQCPYCGCHITVSADNSEIVQFNLTKLDKKGKTKGVSFEHIVCPNQACRRTILIVDIRYNLVEDFMMTGKTVDLLSNNRIINQKQLLPFSSAKHFPEYIPEAIRQDYEEACLIRDLSPKASATLARRCLQGMIRDFWRIRKSRLCDEIAALEDKVDIEEWEAIDALRKIGNIGAHMEKDVNVIIDIEPEEAGQLIEFIEYLLESWYVERYKRREHLARVKQMAEEKKPTANS